MSIINVKTSLRTSWSYFRDPFALYAGFEGAKYVFSTKELFSQAEILLMPSNEIIIKSGAVFTNADLRGELLQPFAGDNPTRTTGALFTRWMMNIEEHDIDAGLRLDAFSDQQGPALSGHLAIAHEILSGFTMSGKVTRDFRVPSFNELYYLNYGTQFLKPETSMGIDIGCSYDEGDVKGELSIYHMQVKDQILAMPISPVQWRASNIGMVWSSGIEASFGHKISIINGAIQCNYAFKHVIDKSPESDTYESIIPYVPTHTFSSTLISTFSTHTLGIMVTAIGERYGMLGELPESKMNPVILVNPHAELRMRLLDGMLRIRGEIRNLLNEEYQMILNFPLPGRSYIISMGYDL
jgi:outer membrane cobalamin receptor